MHRLFWIKFNLPTIHWPSRGSSYFVQGFLEWCAIALYKLEPAAMTLVAIAVTKSPQFLPLDCTIDNIKTGWHLNQLETCFDFSIHSTKTYIKTKYIQIQPTFTKPRPHIDQNNDSVYFVRLKHPITINCYYFIVIIIKIVGKRGGKECNIAGVQDFIPAFCLFYGGNLNSWPRYFFWWSWEK